MWKDNRSADRFFGAFSKTTRILFPIFITVLAGIFVPNSLALVGFLMFGNLIRECGVLDSLSNTAQNVLANLVTIFLVMGILIIGTGVLNKVTNPKKKD